MFSYKLEKNTINGLNVHPTILARYEGAPSLLVDSNENLNLKEQLCDYLLENNMVKENDVIRHSYSSNRMNNFKTSGENNISPTLDTRSDCFGIVVPNNEQQVVPDDIEIGLYDHTSSDKFANGKRDYGIRNEYGTLKCQPKYSIYNTNDLRIRKLTPKECYRLMGFKDDEFERAEKVNSNAQLYKQARKFNCCQCFSRDI